MPWVRLDDMLPTHPKIRALSDAAFRLYISAICWSNLHHTDGYLPSSQLRWLADIRYPKRQVDQLTEAGLWHPAQGGWQIHDYLEYQPSAKRIADTRAAKSERQARWRKRVDGHVDASADAGVDTSLAHARPQSQSSTTVIPPRTGSGSGTEIDLDLVRPVQAAIAERTGNRVPPDQAAAIIRNLTTNADVHNPAAYTAAAIRRDPNPARFLPTPTPPPFEETRPAGGNPARGETVASIAAQARAAMHREST
jgi:hypothetical protein